MIIQLFKDKPVLPWWLSGRTCLPVQKTSLIQEDPTGYEATKPMHHHYRACAVEPESDNC